MAYHNITSAFHRGDNTQESGNQTLHYYRFLLNPLKGRDVNWLQFAIQV